MTKDTNKALRWCCACDASVFVCRDTLLCPRCGANVDQARSRALASGRKLVKVEKHDDITRLAETGTDKGEKT